MAKLSRGNLAAKEDAQISKVDDWNPPAVPLSAAAQMLPPKSRPLPRIPQTPSGDSHIKSDNSELQTSSSRKKRRRRGGKRNGDSASEVTTNMSEETSHSVTTPSHDSSKVLVPASQAGSSVLPPDASAEQRRIFENEPELFGVFASSDDEDDEEDDQPIKVPHRKARLQTYSPSVATGFAESPPFRARRDTSIASSRAGSARPQIGSDVLPFGTVKTPNAKQHSDDRFDCPLKSQYGCTKTFKDARTAKRHADLHINANRFKCGECDKGFSRQDLLTRHVKTHDQQNGAATQTEVVRVENAHKRQPGGVAEVGTAKGGGITVDVSNNVLDHGLDKTNDEDVAEIEVEDSLRDADATDASEVTESETDDEEQLNTNHYIQGNDSQLDDDARSGMENEPSIVQSNAEEIPTSPTERTIVSSPQRASSPAEKQFSIVDRTTKRKRPSPRSSPEFEVPPSRKRARRDREDDLQFSPSLRQVDTTVANDASIHSAKSSGSAERRASHDMDTELSTGGNGDREEQSEDEEVTEPDTDPASGTDVEMHDGQEVQESDQESASGLKDQVARSPTPIMDNGNMDDVELLAAVEMDDKSSDSVSEDEDFEDEDSEQQQQQNENESDDEEREEEEEEKEKEVENYTDDDADPESPQIRAKASEEPPTTARRQSSMDSFVQPLKSAAPSAKASRSRPGVAVNVPVRSKTQSEKAQSKLSLERQVEPRKFTQTDVPPTEHPEEDESTQGKETRAEVNGKSRALNKGKGKARAKHVTGQDANTETEEKTSSEDRPKATTVARRTSSLGSKSKPQLTSRVVPKKRANPTSDGDESEQMDKPKSKLKRAPKKKQKAPASEGSEESDNVQRKRPVSTAKATWAEASKSGVTGKFTEDEVQTLNYWRDSFCETNNLTTYQFNEMMENTAAITKADWRYDWITKAEFMQQYYEQLPDRNRRSMLRLRERTFNNADTTPWTEDHDKELRQLVAERGTKWVEIAQLMGRTQDSVNQRWRHKLNYGEKPALMGDWTTEEVQKLEDEVTAFAQTKNTTPDDEDLTIPWNAISKKMGTGRTAQQCSNRWRINTSRRVNGKFVKIPHSDRLPGTKVKKPRTPSKMEKRLSGQGTERSGKTYKSAEKVEDSDAEGEGEEGHEDDEEGEGEEDDDEAEDEKEDRDADHASNEGSGNEEPGVEDEQKDVNESQTNSQTALDDEDERQKPGEDSASGSEDVEMTSGSERALSASRDSARKSTTVTARSLGNSAATTKSSPTKRYSLSQPGSLSQPTPKSKQYISHSQTPLTSTQAHLPSSPQPSTLKTPAVSRNPLRQTSRSRSSPSLDLSLSQMYAGTQANSSAKRTTGRTNRTRVQDSAVTENRPSPGLSLRRRPVRSSSLMLSPLDDVSRGTGVDDEEDEESESGDQDSESGHLELDFKSPTSFVSAKDTVGAFASDEEGDQDQQSNDDDESDSDSDSSDSSSTSSGSNSDSPSNQPSASRPTRQDSGSGPGSTFWQSVNQSFRKFTGLSQDGSSRGRGESQEQDQSQSQSQRGTQGRNKSRLSLADVLRRGSGGVEVEEEEESDDDE